MAQRGKSKSGFSKFEGKDIDSTKVEIRNTGSGLSDAMNVDTVELHHSDKVYVVLECEVEKVRFDPIRDSRALARVHMLVAGDATIVDEDLVRAHLDAQAERIEQARGVHRLDFDEDGEGQEGGEE